MERIDHVTLGDGLDKEAPREGPQNVCFAAGLHARGAERKSRSL